MKTVFELTCPLVVSGWFFAAFVRTFCIHETPEEGQ